MNKRESSYLKSKKYLKKGIWYSGTYLKLYSDFLNKRVEELHKHLNNGIYHLIKNDNE